MPNRILGSPVLQSGTGSVQHNIIRHPDMPRAVFKTDVGKRWQGGSFSAT